MSLLQMHWNSTPLQLHLRGKERSASHLLMPTGGVLVRLDLAMAALTASYGKVESGHRRSSWYCMGMKAVLGGRRRCNVSLRTSIRKGGATPLEWWGRRRRWSTICLSVATPKFCAVNSNSEYRRHSSHLEVSLLTYIAALMLPI